MRPESLTTTIHIGGREVSAAAPLFVSAEIGMNHGGSTDQAISLVEAAAETGADAVTLQTIDAAQLASPTAPMASHLPKGSLIDFFERHQLDEPAHVKIVACARKHGLKVIATPFSLDGVDLLERVGVDAYKIASGDLTWDLLITRVAETRKPIIIATGMATLDEIAHAMDVARMSGAVQIALLHTVSAHPVPPGSENLLAIRTIAEQFRVPVGLADHAEDTFAVPMAMALGACIYERHLVLPDDLHAVDLAVSSLPDELCEAINVARRAHAALGHGEKRCLEVEMMNRHIYRRALCAARDLEPGMVLRKMDLVALRPANGLPPSQLNDVAGCRLLRPLDLGQPIRDQDIAPRVLEDVSRRSHAS
jgi:sialic acid synthase SpsE